MKILQLYLLTLLSYLITCEPPSSRKPLVFPNWPPKSNHINYASKPNIHNSPITSASQKQKTLVVQIRSDKRVPIHFKRSPYQNSILGSSAGLINRPMMHRPMKMAINQPHYMIKGNHMLGKHIRKPVGMLKLKFTSPKPMGGYSEKPYIYEKPSFSPASELQKLPIKNAVMFAPNHFVPIHTIPAPNLATYDNHIHQDNYIRHEIESHYKPPLLTTSDQFNHYRVTEDEQTNDHTLIDPLSGKQKYFAPDPDPSLPTHKIRPAIEPFNIPSNGQQLPSDVQNNYLPPQSQPLIQFSPNSIQSQQQVPEVYELPIANQPQLQQYLLQQASVMQSPQMAVYNPTYLVTQSRNLYQKHQNQKKLFHPNQISQYANADMTQEVASDGQILQSAKDYANIIHPTFNPSIDISTPDSPTFAALVQQQQHPQSSTINFDQGSNGPEGGFVVSNYFGNTQQDPSPSSYEEYLELSQRQRENDRTLAQANLELQKQLLEQDSPATSAYEEHQRLLNQHLGTPLRIFVPDDDYPSEKRNSLTKRSDETESLGNEKNSTKKGKSDNTKPTKDETNEE